MESREINEYLETLGRKATFAKTALQKLTTEQKDHALKSAASALVKEKDSLLAANEKDYQRARAAGMAEGLLDRLRLTPERIEAMAEGLLQIAALQDPVGDVIEAFDRPNGLHIEKVRVPMGVIGIIYEARPNVTADAFGLCFTKTIALPLGYNPITMEASGFEPPNSERAVLQTAAFSHFARPP